MYELYHKYTLGEKVYYEAQDNTIIPAHVAQIVVTRRLENPNISDSETVTTVKYCLRRENNTTIEIREPVVYTKDEAMKLLLHKHNEAILKLFS